MRNICCELSNDKKSIVLGSGWDKTTGKINQLGLITKREDSVIYLDFEFKLPNGQVIRKEKAGVDEILESITDYLNKEDLIAICGFLYLWG